MRKLLYALLLSMLIAGSSLMTATASSQTADKQYGLTYEPCDATPDTTFPPEGSNAPTAGNDCFMLYQGQRELPQIYMNDIDPLNVYEICDATSVPSSAGKVIHDGGIIIEVAPDATEPFSFVYTMCNDEGSDSAEVTIIPLELEQVKVKKLKNKMFRVENPNTRESGYVNFTWGDIDGYTCGQKLKTIQPGATVKLKAICKKVTEWSASVGRGEAPAGRGKLKY